MKKRIGVITMYRRNYGAFLQAYALQKKLICLGYEAELIRYDYYKDRAIFEVPLIHMRNPIKFCREIAVAILRTKQKKQRVMAFDKSIKRNLRESDKYYRTEREMEKDPPIYDIYLTGSDQVFNPFLSPQAYRSRMLSFACRQPGRKVSYAASIGLKKYPEQHTGFFIDALNKFDALSVREQEAVRMINQLTGKKVEQHIDPCFLLSRDEWIDFLSGSPFPKEPYILFYMVQKQQRVIDYAKALSKKTGLPVFSVDGRGSFSNSVSLPFPSPESFVASFLNAKYVVTNSFHGTAFSILFHKKAHIVLPDTGSERILNILENCDLMRLLDNEMIGFEEDGYAAADQYLEKERKRSEDYLKGIGE